MYGLAEVYGDAVRDVDFISNPGCFPTATLLGLIPAVKAGCIDPSTIIIDAKSGVSGAGRGVSLGTHYSEINENFKAYKINKHQHIPEIEQVLSDMAGEPVVTYVHDSSRSDDTRNYEHDVCQRLMGERTERGFYFAVSQLL